MAAAFSFQNSGRRIRAAGGNPPGRTRTGIKIRRQRRNRRCPCATGAGAETRALRCAGLIVSWLADSPAAKRNPAGRALALEFLRVEDGAGMTARERVQQLRSEERRVGKGERS